METGHKYKILTCEICGKPIAENWYIRHMKANHAAQIIDAVSKIELPLDVTPQEEKEVLGGLLLVVIAAAKRKASAGLDYAGSGQHQDYPPGMVEIGVAKDAVDMVIADVIKFVRANLSCNERHNPETQGCVDA